MTYQRPESRPLRWSALLLILLPVALLVAWRLPLAYPAGGFIVSVLDVARTGHVASTFTPDTYPFLVGITYRAAGARIVVLCQAFIYLLLGVSVFHLVRELGSTARASFFAALVIALDPDLLVSIPKIWDTEITCLLLIGITAMCIGASRNRSPWLLGALGATWGFAVSIRPSFAMLVIPIAAALIFAHRRTWPVKVLGVAALAFVVVAGMNTMAHGSFYFPQNGAYQLFAGANPFTEGALLAHWNAESSVEPALAAIGVHTNNPYDLALRPIYWHEAVGFVLHHPVRWIWLGCLKLITLLRPDTQAHPAFSLGYGVKIVTSACVPLWLIGLAATHKFIRADAIVLLTVLGYVLPFLLTDADPRFRVPLDVLVLSHAAAMILRHYRFRERSRMPARQVLPRA